MPVVRMVLPDRWNYTRGRSWFQSIMAPQVCTRRRSDAPCTLTLSTLLLLMTTIENGHSWANYVPVANGSVNGRFEGHRVVLQRMQRVSDDVATSELLVVIERICLYIDHNMRRCANSDLETSGSFCGSNSVLIHGTKPLAPLRVVNTVYTVVMP